MVIMATMAPAALAHAGHGGHGIAAQMDRALLRAPLEQRGRCASTTQVPGLGPSCRTRDGLFRLPAPDGSTYTTHGLDSPPPKPLAGYLPDSQTALDTATADDVTCAPTNERHTLMIYAYPSNQASRYATIAPLLRQETYKLSAFLTAESQSMDSNTGKELRVACDAGTPRVTAVQLATNSSVDSFSTVVNDLAAQGYGGTMSTAVTDRYLVFYDSTVGSGAAGTGHLFRDDSPSTDSANNSGGLVAVEFAWSGTPHWDVLLHEAGHNMGAVQYSAPNTSDTTWGAHCNDGIDIMCYSDGMAQSNYNGSVCAIEVFDCNRNDYFNSDPAPGSYLDTHWNIAGTYNGFLEHTTADNAAPTEPGALSLIGASDDAVGLSWTGSTDNVGIAGYRVYQDTGGGGWVSLGTTSQRFFTISGLDPSTGYTFGVTAFDAAGNVSTRAELVTATNNTPDATAPAAPAAPAKAGATVSSVTLAWIPPTDNVGIYGYTIYRQSGGVWSSIGTADMGDTSFTVTGLLPGQTYGFAIAANDSAGNESTYATLAAATLEDAASPARPRRPVLRQAFHRSLKIGWAGASDNIGVTRYRIYRLSSTGWKLVGAASGSTRSKTIRNLRPGKKYRLMIRAGDAAGNFSPPSRILSTRTKG